jgi:hypothetical protein
VKGTIWSTPLCPATVPHNFTHKRHKCQYISKHQDIENCLQVTDRPINCVYLCLSMTQMFLFLHAPLSCNGATLFHSQKKQVPIHIQVTGYRKLSAGDWQAYQLCLFMSVYDTDLLAFARPFVLQRCHIISITKHRTLSAGDRYWQCCMWHWEMQN